MLATRKLSTRRMAPPPRVEGVGGRTPGPRQAAARRDVPVPLRQPVAPQLLAPVTLVALRARQVELPPARRVEIAPRLEEGPRRPTRRHLDRHPARPIRQACCGLLRQPLRTAPSCCIVSYVAHT